jgi:hypothetical protein
MIYPAGYPANEHLQYFSREAAKKDGEENSGSEPGAEQ